MSESVADMNVAIWKKVCELLGIPPDRIVGLTLGYTPASIPIADVRYVLFPRPDVARSQIEEAFALAAGSAGKVEVKFGTSGGLGMCGECMKVTDTLTDGLCRECAAGRIEDAVV